MMELRWTDRNGNTYTGEPMDPDCAFDLMHDYARALDTQRVELLDSLDRSKCPRCPLGICSAHYPLGSSGWQPIETAPTDGTRVWIGEEGHYETAYWTSTCGAWSGWYENDQGQITWEPTHWMPLPDPPEKK